MHKDSHKFTDAGKYCPSCDRTLPNENFCRNKRYISGLNHRCRECARRDNVFSRYRLTGAQHQAMLESQDYRCANKACREIIDLSSDIDHDHSCCNSSRQKICGKCIRGILCRRCNNLLTFAENTALLQGALSYLEDYRSRKNLGILKHYEWMVEESTGAANFYATAANIEKNLDKAN